jgi:hypothetical protein
MIYFAYFYAVLEYGIIFWGDSVESKRIFQQQKRIIRIMTGSTLTISCKTLFKKLEILTLTSQYKFNTSVHNTNNRRKLKLHKPPERLTIYQRSVYYNSINIYNKLPDDLAEIVSNKKCFLLQLKIYLTDKPFYSVEEYLNAQ